VDQKGGITFTPEYVRYIHGLELVYFAVVLASHIVLLYILRVLSSPYSGLIFIGSLVFWWFNVRNILLAGRSRQERQELERLLGPL
jgi:hypothetical protein